MRNYVRLWALAAPIAFAGIIAGANNAASDGALVVSTADPAKDGIAYGGAIGYSTIEQARSLATKNCQGYKPAPRAAQSCRLVGTFSDGCMAVAFDRKGGNTAIGSAVAADWQTAERRALDACRATSLPARRGACKLDYLRCEHKDRDREIDAQTRILALFPKVAAAHVNRGIAYENKKDYDRAIADYSEAIKLEPTASRFHYRANINYTTKNYDQAIADYNEAIRLEPNALRYTDRADTYHIKKDYDHAIADYGEAIRREPTAARYTARGNSYVAKKDYPQAIADYSEAIKLEPTATRLVDRANAYDNMKDTDRAIADYGEAIRLDPKKTSAYNNRGYAYFRKKEYDRAIADYTEAIKIEPNVTLYYNNRVNAYRAKGDSAHAIADYGEVIRISPKSAWTYHRRGMMELYNGSPEKALADLSQASDIDPKDAYHALWLDIVGQRNKVPSRLAQAIAQFDMTTWPAPVVRLYLGQLTPAAVLAAADNPDPTKKATQVCEANFYSGEVALRQGTKDEAARLFKAALSGCPQSFIEWEGANAELKALGMTP